MNIICTQRNVTSKCNFHTFSVQLSFDGILQSRKSEVMSSSQGRRLCVAIFFHLSAPLFHSDFFFAIVALQCGIRLC